MIRKGIAIAGIRGGSGKTVIAMGIARALTRRGYKIAPFKKGPDYIDPGWLGAAAGYPCHNLDTYLMNEKDVVSSYLLSNPGCQIALMEGNRGLFDGVDADGTHSAAELAKLLGIPLVLVADCTKSTRTIAALVHGCATFDRDVPLRGVILNNIAGERHESVIVKSIRQHCDVPVLGAVPRMRSLGLTERHLGLTTVYEHPGPDVLIDEVAGQVESCVDLDAMLDLINNHRYRDLTPAPAGDSDDRAARSADDAGRIVIGVVFDRAFNFYYPDTIDAMERLGAAVVRIDSLCDKSLPPIDALYIGGGFPENHAEALAGNEKLRHEIHTAIEGGLPVYAECGGLIYLSAGIRKGSSLYPMVGIFPFQYAQSARPAAHGYTGFTVDGENRYYAEGASVKGHEFRYLQIINEADISELNTVFRMDRGTGIMKGRDGLVYKNAFATFCHTHVKSDNVQWVDRLYHLSMQRR